MRFWRRQLRDHWAKEKIRLARFLYASMAAQVYMNYAPGAACHSTARLMTDRVTHGTRAPVMYSRQMIRRTGSRTCTTEYLTGALAVFRSRGGEGKAGGSYGSNDRNIFSGPSIRNEGFGARSGIYILCGINHRAGVGRERGDLQPGRRRPAEVGRLSGAGTHRAIVGEAPERRAQRHRPGELHRLDEAKPIV